MSSSMRDYTGTMLKLRRSSEGRWSWSVHIPAWVTEKGLKATGCAPSGTERSRKKAIAAAEKAVRRQRDEDEQLIEHLTWSPLNGFR